MTDIPQSAHPSARHLVALVCAAQVLVQIGAFFWPALLPGMMARWGPDQQRGRVDHRDLLRRLHDRGAGAGHADRPHRHPAGLSRRRRHDGRRPPAVRSPRGRVLVGAGHPRAHRRRLGRHLHDRAQASRRQGRRQADVAGGGRARRQHRHFRRIVVRLCRSHRRLRRVARRLCGSGGERRARLAAGRASWFRAPSVSRFRRGASMRCSTFGRCCATARRWPMRSPIASIRSR